MMIAHLCLFVLRTGGRLSSAMNREFELIMTNPAHAEQPIRDAFAAWGAAWNSGDLEGYLTAYRDSDQTRYISNGKVIQGRAAIVSAYRARFPEPAMLGQLAVKQLEVELMGDQDALVFGLWHLQREDFSGSGAFTVHVRCFDGRWLIVTDHTSG